VCVRSSFRSGVLLTNLQIEREWRQTLEEQALKLNQEITLLKEKVSLMDSLKDELQQLKLEHQDLKDTCKEQELTITDLAGQLGQYVSENAVFAFSSRLLTL